ncbi:hypothetical protein JKP88DRAFT_255080 [Tribonema minus]|uniref:Uncharacterized protein n=1 Tax=Tribonema minus TaxID=303371 RepID=A0A835Z1E4_9STRA|nr:hypothetical protein JKP88DRAFT_255080 [Tribonema minus]
MSIAARSVLFTTFTDRSLRQHLQLKTMPTLRQLVRHIGAQTVAILTAICLFLWCGRARRSQISGFAASDMADSNTALEAAFTGTSESGAFTTEETRECTETLYWVTCRKVLRQVPIAVEAGPLQENGQEPVRSVMVKWAALAIAVGLCCLGGWLVVRRVRRLRAMARVAPPNPSPVDSERMKEDILADYCQGPGMEVFGAHYARVVSSLLEITNTHFDQVSRCIFAKACDEERGRRRDLGYMAQCLMQLRTVEGVAIVECNGVPGDIVGHFYRMLHIRAAALMRDLWLETLREVAAALPSAAAAATNSAAAEVLQLRAKVQTGIIHPMDSSSFDRATAAAAALWDARNNAPRAAAAARHRRCATPGVAALADVAAAVLLRHPRAGAIDHMTRGGRACHAVARRRRRARCRRVAARVARDGGAELACGGADEQRRRRRQQRRRRQRRRQQRQRRE